MHYKAWTPTGASHSTTKHSCCCLHVSVHANWCGPCSLVVGFEDTGTTTMCLAGKLSKLTRVLSSGYGSASPAACCAWISHCAVCHPASVALPMPPVRAPSVGARPSAATAAVARLVAPSAASPATSGEAPEAAAFGCCCCCRHWCRRSCRRCRPLLLPAVGGPAKQRNSSRFSSHVIITPFPITQKRASHLQAHQVRRAAGESSLLLPTACWQI